MEIIISARHFELTEAVKEHATAAIEAAFGDYRSRITKVTLVLSEQRSLKRANLNVAFKGFPIEASSEEHDNLFKTIDEAVDRASSQMYKHMEKLQIKKGDTIKDHTMPEEDEDSE